jgi:hypothetical protein
MATTGAKFPTLGTTTAELPYDDFAWQTPTNIYSNDGNNAYVDDNAFDSGLYTGVLKASGFDFSAIPDGSTILGVEVKIEAHYTVGTAQLSLAQLLDVNGAKVGTNLCATPVALTVTNPTVITRGAADNLWGNVLTAAWVKDPDFGVALGIDATGNNSNVYIDYVTMEVTYDPPAPVNISVNDAVGLTDVPTMSIPVLIVLVASLIGLTDFAAIPSPEINVFDDIGVTDSRTAAVIQLFEYYNTGDDSVDQPKDANWFAETFTPQVSHRLSKVRVKVLRVSGTGNAVISIRNTDVYGGGPERAPTGADIYSSSVDGSSWDGTATWRDFEIADGPVLYKDTTYAALLHCTGDLWLQWRLDWSSPSYGRGNQAGSLDAGVNWSALPSEDEMFEEYGEALLDTSGFDSVSVTDEVAAELLAGSILSVNVNDAIGLTDEAVADLTLYEIAPYDAVGINDSAAGELTIYEVAVNDAITVTDDVQAVPSPQVSAADDVGISDEVSAQLSLYEIAVGDLIDVVEDVAAALSLYEVAPYDAIGLQDEPTVAMTAGAILEVSVFDLVHIHPAYRRPDVSDSIGLTDSVSASIPVLLVSVYDSINVTDNVQADIPASATVDAVAYDNLAITDEPGISIPVLVVSIFDSVGVSDATENSLTLYEALAYDTLDVSDEPALQLVGAGLLLASADDAVGLTDEASLSIPVLLVSVNDSIGVQDSTEASLSLYQASLFDQIDVTDYTEANLVGAGIHSVNVADDIAITDAAETSVPVLVVSAYDSLSVSDQPAISIPLLLISVADNVAVQDESSGFIGVLLATVSDNIGVTDETQVQIPILAVSVNEAIGLTDTISASVPTLLVSTSDNVTLQDATEAALTLYEILVDDALDVAEYTETQLFGAGLLALNVNDAVGLTDSVSAGLTPYLLNVADDLAITDSATGLLTIYEIVVFDTINVGEFCQLSIPGLVLEPYVSEAIALTDNRAVAIAIYPFLQAILNVKANESVLVCRDTGSVVDVADTGSLLTVTR